MPAPASESSLFLLGLFSHVCILIHKHTLYIYIYTRWFKYDRDLCGLFTHKSVLVIFESPCIWLYSSLDRGRFFSFLILYAVGRTPLTGDQPVARPLPTLDNIRQNKRTQRSRPWAGFEPMIPVFVRAKTIHALDRAATAIGNTHREKARNPLLPAFTNRNWHS
jgi:hypothetical protein